MGFILGFATFAVWFALLFVGIMVGLPIWYTIRTRNGIPGAEEDALGGDATGTPATGSHA